MASGLGLPGGGGDATGCKPRERELVDGGSVRWLGLWRDVHVKAGRAQMVVLDQTDGFFSPSRIKMTSLKLPGSSINGQRGQAEGFQIRNRKTCPVIRGAISSKRWRAQNDKKMGELFQQGRYLG